MHPPEPDPIPLRTPAGAADGYGSAPSLSVLTLQAFQLRSQHRYALHPVEAAIRYHGPSTQGTGAPCDAAVGFEQAEGHYRAGSQGLRLSEIPQLPQQLRELSRLSVVDRAGRKALRKWGAEADLVIDEAEFFRRWQEQGKPGGAEHQVFHDKNSNRWFKRLTSDLEMSYNKHYIGFRVDGKACNFATCRPRRSAMWLAIALPKSEEIDTLLATSDLDLLEYNSRDQRYRFRINEGDPAKHAVILKDLLKRSYDRRNAE